MMKEYIEREKVVELTEVIKYSFAPLHQKVIDALIYNIDKNIPSADVEPVRHAYWTGRLPSDNAFAEGFADWFTEEDKRTYRDMEAHVTHCSNCKGGFDDRRISDWKYCPYCGAKMDGGEK